MALTVGVLAAIGALLLLQNKVQRKGVIRPLEPEIYIPGECPSKLTILVLPSSPCSSTPLQRKPGPCCFLSLTRLSAAPVSLLLLTE